MRPLFTLQVCKGVSADNTLLGFQQINVLAGPIAFATDVYKIARPTQCELDSSRLLSERHVHRLQWTCIADGELVTIADEDLEYDVHVTNLMEVKD